MKRIRQKKKRAARRIPTLLDRVCKTRGRVKFHHIVVSSRAHTHTHTHADWTDMFFWRRQAHWERQVDYLSATSVRQANVIIILCSVIISCFSFLFSVDIFFSFFNEHLRVSFSLSSFAFNSHFHPSSLPYYFFFSVSLCLSLYFTVVPIFTFSFFFFLLVQVSLCNS